MTQSQSKVPVVEAEKVETFILYDPSDGRIAHVHQSVVLPGGKSPSHEEIEKHVRHAFASGRARHAGMQPAVDVSGLRWHHHTGEEMKPHVRYKMDVEARRVVERKG